MTSVEWTEFERLTIRLDVLLKLREAAPKGRIGWLREIDGDILRLEEARERVFAHLARQIAHRVRSIRKREFPDDGARC
jgi:hypothetical protein